MNRSFFQELLSSVMKRGREALALRSGGKNDFQMDVLEVANAILSEKGEASGLALARYLLDCFFKLDDSERVVFFAHLLSDFGPDVAELEKAIENYQRTPNDLEATKLHNAAEPRRQELIRRLNRAPNGTASLVAIREDLLSRISTNEEFKILDQDFKHLLIAWFNRGFLMLERIDWSSSAVILDKIIRYEAVHEIHGWDDLRSRIDVADRRCYAFFHPAMPDDPLIFVEVALTRKIPEAIAPILANDRDQISSEDAKTAVFYSISNCQAGLKGISFGNFLIKQVVQELAREMPHLKNFVTLSPVPVFLRWLDRIREDKDSTIISMVDRETLALIDNEDWQNDPAVVEQVKGVLLPLCACYFLEAKTKSGEPLDPVARFHLGNGAVLARVNWLGDVSKKGLKQSAGFMVNYLYDLPLIEENHQKYAENYTINAATEVRNLLKSMPADRELVTAHE